MDRPELVQWLHEQVRRRLVELYEIEVAMDVHQAFYGVPVGPTLSMVYPVEVKGLRGHGMI